MMSGLTAVLAVLLAAAAGGCVYGWRRNRKMYRVIDRMLDLSLCAGAMMMAGRKVLKDSYLAQ